MDLIALSQPFKANKKVDRVFPPKSTMFHH